MTTPERPEGVVLHTTTGPVPVDLTYVGVRDGDGIHVWHASTTLPVDLPLHITAETIPAKTSIVFHLRGDQ